MIDEDTVTERVLQVGRFALVAANDRDARHRTVRVYDLQSVPEACRPLPDGSDLQGQFVCSYYLSTLLAYNLTADASAGLSLAGGVPEWTIPAKDWPEVAAWLTVMAR